eukprot:gene2277-23514_t
MREAYGKLICLMQDANRERIRRMMGMDINMPIRTVLSELREHKGGGAAHRGGGRRRGVMGGG